MNNVMLTMLRLTSLLFHFVFRIFCIIIIFACTLKIDENVFFRRPVEHY